MRTRAKEYPALEVTKALKRAPRFKEYTARKVKKALKKVSKFEKYEEPVNAADLQLLDPQKDKDYISSVLPPELEQLIHKNLTLIDSVCLGLTSRKWYLIHKRRFGTKISLIHEECYDDDYMPDTMVELNFYLRMWMWNSARLYWGGEFKIDKFITEKRCEKLTKFWNKSDGVLYNTQDWDAFKKGTEVEDTMEKLGLETPRWPWRDWHWEDGYDNLQFCGRPTVKNGFPEEWSDYEGSEDEDEDEERMEDDDEDEDESAEEDEDSDD